MAGKGSRGGGDQDKPLTCKQAIRFFSIAPSHDTVRRWCETKVLAAAKVGGRWFTSRRAVDLFVAYGTPKRFYAVCEKSVGKKTITRAVCNAAIDKYEAERAAAAAAILMYRDCSDEGSRS